MGNQYTKKEININEIVSLYNSGISFTKIALDFKIGKNRVKKILIENDNFIQNRDTLKKIFNDFEINDIKDLYLNKKLSCKEIGKIYNISREPIQELLRNLGLLNKGNSNGVKIVLTEEKEEKIKKLYLNECKNTDEISNELGLSKSYISKYLTNSGNIRSRSLATSLSKLGIPLSNKTKMNMSLAQQKLSKSGLRKQTGGVCKFFKINNLTCQGTYEKFYIESLIKDGKLLPTEAKPIITPFGVYNPDFEFNDRLIEIKSDYTYDILIGEKINRFTNKIDIKQYEKIKWVNKNIKSIEILIIDKRKNNIIKKQIKQ